VFDENERILIFYFILGVILNPLKIAREKFLSKYLEF